MVRYMVVIALVVGVMGLLAKAPSASADAGSKAGCMGIESSSVAPPGTSDEDPGGRAQASREVKELAEQFGVTPGHVIGLFAHLHEGSHEACDEALG
jgi:hypothetical protein